MKDFSNYPIQKQKLQTAIAVFSAEDQKHIMGAIRVAEQHHAGQERDGEEVVEGGYVIHCIRAALWLVENNVAETAIIIATILHDTLEDTKLTEKEIEDAFGATVLQLVLSVTRPRPDDETEEQKRASKAKFFTQALHADEKTRLIKTADQLDNLRSWQYHPSNFFKFPRWIDEANYFTIPIAKTVNQQAADEMKLIVTTTKERIV